MTFRLDNCRVVGERGNIVCFNLGPRSTRLIHIVPINNSIPFIGEMVDEQSRVYIS